MAARALLMYLLLVVIVRSAKKRFLSNATAFDFILTVVIGSVAARAMTGEIILLPRGFGWQSVKGRGPSYVNAQQSSVNFGSRALRVETPRDE